MNKILILPLAAALAAPAYAVTFQRWQTADGATVTYAERRELPIVHMEIVFKGAGQTGEGSLDLANLLKPYLETGSVRFIGNHGIARGKLAALLGELGGLAVPS